MNFLDDEKTGVMDRNRTQLHDSFSRKEYADSKHSKFSSRIYDRMFELDTGASV